MLKVAVVTDSTTNIPKDIMKDYDIRVAHARILWEGEEFRDGIDIQPNEFYERLETVKEMPTTSQATPEDFREVFDQLISEGYEILSIVISSKLSGTYNSVVQAKAFFPGEKIEIIDSMIGAMGAGWPILEVVKAAKQGASLLECKSIAENALQNVGILLMMDTLEYLHRGGRIGGAQRFLGAALNLKPILEIVDGGFEGLERVRSHSKALTRLVEILEERIAGRKHVHLAALHANALDVAEQLLEAAQSRVHPVETLISDVSPAVGVHLGPGTAGFAFMAGVG